MTFNEFNSKINLPEVCRMAGISGLNYIKLPTFGWYGYNANLSQIVHLFQLFDDKDIFGLYRKFTLEMPELQEFSMTYSETEGNQLYEDYAKTRLWGSFFRDARLETQKLEMRDRPPFKQIMKECGFPNLPADNVGYITEALLKKHVSFRMHPSPVGYLVVPTFCTPKHICSLELVDPKTMLVEKTIFKNGEKGWYGELGGVVVPDLPTLGRDGGFTWDSKCDFWTTKPLTLSKKMSVSKCVEVWLTAHNTKFDMSPIEVIKANKKEDEIVTVLSRLTLSQAMELESILKCGIVNKWEIAQQQTVEIGRFKFHNKKSQYYVAYMDEVPTEFTNFTMQIDRIIRNGNRFYRQGVIRFENREAPFVFDEESFTTSNTLSKAIRAFFLQHGLGVPIILSLQHRYLLDVVNRFNRGAKIENLSSPVE